MTPVVQPNSDQDALLLAGFSERASGPAELFFRVGPDGQYLLTHANSQAANFLGVKRISLNEPPIRWEDLPNHLAIYLSQILETLATDEHAALPIFETETPECRSFAVKALIEKRLESEGWHYWFFISFSDVTPWLGLQEEVMNARKLESIGALASGVAHDFNNLIMAIQGHAEFFLMTRLKDPEICDAMERIMKACANGASLTRSLLGYARKQSLLMDSLNLADLVQDVVGLARRSYGSRYLIELDPALEPAPDQSERKQFLINGCYSALSHCLLNVLNNSRDAMPTGGRIRVFCQEDSESTRLVVSDEGSGIDPRDLPRIFDPFFTTKGVGTGTGLGLPMVQGIMKQHGGRVEVQSEKGTGTQFTFHWPASRLPNDGNTDLQPVTDQNKNPFPLPTVGDVPRLTYIIEDDENVSASILSLMKLNHYECKSFGDPHKVLKMLEAGDLPGIIMVDYTMPDMDGIEFIRSAYRIMRSTTKQPFLKIVLMSGYPPEHFSELLREFDGAPLYLLQKPFSSETMSRILRSSHRRFLRKITSRVNVLPAAKPHRP